VKAQAGLQKKHRADTKIDMPRKKKEDIERAQEAVQTIKDRIVKMVEGDNELRETIIDILSPIGGHLPDKGISYFYSLAEPYASGILMHSFTPGHCLGEADLKIAVKKLIDLLPSIVTLIALSPTNNKLSEHKSIN